MPRLVDLSVPVMDQAEFEPWKPTIRYLTHEGEGLAWVKAEFGVEEADLVWSDGKGAAFEEVHLITHTGTHIDAPWHYGPLSEGRPARTVDQCPLEWFYGDGVVLDVRHRKPGELITVEDLEAALARIPYRLKPYDIVLIQTGCDRWESGRAYFRQPGMSRESTLWLVEQGIKVIGIDAYGFDLPFEDMRETFRRTRDGRIVWQAHFAGITREYCQIEKLANLDQIGRAVGFKVACFPVKVVGASGAWCRAVALVEDEEA
ncbi:MAG: cyclase family protein [Actinomycetia bacterium]|nr:cyclase family protein [Actinomycetes bacterium]